MSMEPIPEALLQESEKLPVLTKESDAVLKERFLQEQESFRDSSIYRDVLKQLEPQSVLSVIRLAATIQSSFLFVGAGIQDAQVRRTLSDQRIEYGSRIGATMLREDPSELSYQRGNLQAWLSQKGLSVDVASSHIGKEVVFAGGKNEYDILLSGEQMNPGAAVVLIDQMRARIDDLLAHEEIQGNLDLLVVVSKVFQLIREEIEAAVVGTEVPQERYLQMLDAYLDAIGLHVSKREQVVNRRD